MMNTLEPIFCSASAAGIAELVTLPLDTAKVRLQLQNRAIQSKGGSKETVVKYRGPFQTIYTIWKEEGVHRLFRGLEAGLHRQAIFTGLRLGLYDNIKRAISGDKEPNLRQKMSSALITSAIGITCANPSDVIKIRFQAHEGSQPRYPSARAAYSIIVQKEGVVGGLYRGYWPNLYRNCIISTIELSGYDQVKTLLMRAGFPDDMQTHLVSGLCAGFMATVLGSPMDVVSTRLMAQTSSKQESLGNVIYTMIKNEGIFAFWQGFWPNFARIGSFNIVMWMSYEQIKKLFA